MAGLLDRRHALCDPLNTEHKQILFGDQGRNIDSAALIPLRTDD